MAEDRPLGMLPEQEGERADGREERRDEDDGDVRGVHQADRIPTASSAGHSVGEGELDAGRFDVGDEEEDPYRADQGDERIRRLYHDLLDPPARELGAVVVPEIEDGLRDRARGGASRARGLPVERPRENLLGNSARNEQGDPGANSPLRDDLIHEEHEVRAREQLDDDQELRKEVSVARRNDAEQERSVQVRDEGRGRRQEPEDLRDRLDEDHDNHEEFLRALVDALVLVVLQVEIDDLRAREELHDDRGGDDRTDPEMHEGALGPREDGAQAREKVDDVPLVQAVNENIRHGELQDQG